MQTSLPEPPDPGVLNALRFGMDTFRFLEGIQARFPDGTAVPIPGRPPLVILTNPSLVREALGRPERFQRVPAQESAALIAERGLVQTEDEFWQQQRSIMNPAFTGRQVAVYADTTGQRASTLAAEWARDGAQKVNLHREMTSLTLRVASEILLGEDIGREQAWQFHDWMHIASQEFEFSIDIVTPDWIPKRISPEFREAAREI